MSCGSTDASTPSRLAHPVTPKLIEFNSHPLSWTNPFLGWGGIEEGRDTTWAVPEAWSPPSPVAGPLALCTIAWDTEPF